METTNTIQIGALIMGLFGGLAIFLYGMEQMDNALKRVAGGKMKKLLAKATDNRLKGVATGAFVTAVVQSSSVTTVLVVGFISAGLMSLSQSIGVIMGANIGTTITAQIVAFKVTQYALVMVAVGFVMYFFFKQDKHEKLRQYGLMLLGLGLVFFGLTLMSGATKPLRTYQPFIDLMQQMSNPLLGILVGALFTALVQSSSATTGVIIVLASQGFITLEAGIALAFGANLGTCVTALLAAIGKPREAVQASMVHLVFNIAGVLLWFGFIDQLAYIVRLISPAASELTGSARLAAETPRQIANAHTLFNVANTAIFIWFTVPIARLMQYLIPERKTEPALAQPNYLDPILVETPELALDQVKLELGRLGGYVRQMLDRALPAVFSGSREDLNSLIQMDRNVDRLYGEIFAYLNRLSRENLLTSQSVQLSNYMSAANAIENIGNRVKMNVVEAGTERIKHDAHISQSTQEVLKSLHEKVSWAVEKALDSLVESDGHLAEEVIAKRAEINHLIYTAENHLVYRLAAEEPNRAVLFRMETEIIEYLKRVYYFSERIAQVTANMTQEVNPFSDDPPAGPNGFGVKPIMERPKDLPLTTASPGQYQPASPGAGAAVGG